MKFSALKTFLQKFLETSAADPDDARRRKLLNVILAGIGAIVILADIYVGWVAWKTPSGFSSTERADALRIGLVSAVILFGAAAFYFINRFVSGLLAGFLFVAFLLGVLPLSDSPAQLTEGRSVYVFILPIVMAGALLPSWAVFIFAFLSAVVMLAVAFFNGMEAARLTVMAFFFVAFLVWLSTRSLEQALRETRLINANLDRAVREKTEELAQTLRRELILAGRNQAILDSISEGVVVFDEKQKAILANPALSRLTGIPLATLQSIDAADFAEHPGLSPAGQAVTRQAIEQPESLKEVKRVEWNGKTLALSAARAQNFGSALVFRDATKEAEVEKMKENFVAIVSHELRTPLNAIMGYAEMLRESFYGPVSEKQSVALERIMVNVRRMFSMVGDLLDEAQLKAGKLAVKNEVFDLGDWANQARAALEKAAADKGLGFEVELDPDLPPALLGDPQRLHQIAVNLANNALKFTERGEVRVKLLRSGETRWEIQVSDTGVGVSPEELPRIFEPFRQAEETPRRRYGGFGLGLAIVKQLTDLMQGTITVRSEIGKGSVFIVSLPLRPPPRTMEQP